MARTARAAPARAAHNGATHARAPHARAAHARAIRMRVVIAALSILAVPGAASGQSATDLWIAPLSGSGDSLSIGRPTRLTDRDGYDNQPAFTPDGSAVLYTSIDAAGQADIQRIDVASGRSSRVTRTTPESEYSAAVMPDGERISVVRVEADSTQRLWSFAPDGTDPRLVLEDVAPVGYYAWGDDHILALFVLGTPATLQVADTRSGRATTVARDIGRGIRRIPGSRAVSFIQHVDSTTSRVMRLDLDTGSATPLVDAPPGGDDHAWTSDGTLLMASGSTIRAWRAGRPWRVVADLGPGISGITRIAVSGDGRSLAFVADHASSTRKDR